VYWAVIAGLADENKTEGCDKIGHRRLRQEVIPRPGPTGQGYRRRSPVGQEENPEEERKAVPRMRGTADWNPPGDGREGAEQD
jgi:hypothetical protein